MTRGRIGTARVGVLTIIDEEFECAQNALQATKWVQGAYYTTNKRTHEVVLRQAADRGNIQAVHPTQDIIERFQPEVLMIIGIAGGIYGRDSVQLGDVVVADYLHYAEFRKMNQESDRPRFAAYDHPAVSLREDLVDPARRRGWQERIQAPRPQDGEPRVHIGGVVATEKVMGSPSHPEQRRLVSTFDDALAVEMESIGVGRAVHEARGDVSYNVRFLVIRGISDLVHAKRSRFFGSLAPRDDGVAVTNNSNERAEWKQYAASSAAAFAAELVDIMLSTPNPRP